MEDEFDKFIKLLAGDSAKKEEKLEELFQHALAFFAKFKNTQDHGSQTEVEEMKKKLERVYELVQIESQKMSQKTGLSPTQIKEASSDVRYFTPEQWEALQKMKGELREQTEVLEKEIREKKDKKKQERLAKQRTTIKKKARKKDWLRS